MSKHTLQPQSSSSQAAPPSPLAVFTEQKVKTPSPTPSSRPQHPPPPPPPKPKPQVPRKPQTKRVSFTQEPEYEYLSTNERNTPPPVHDAHDDGNSVDTNDACEGYSSLLIRNRPPKAEIEMSKPVPRPCVILSDDLIIPPPPSFDTDVSDIPLRRHTNIPPPITIVPERIILPEPEVADTSIQSSTTTNSPEAEVPPVNFNSYPSVSQPFEIDHFRSAIISETPAHQIFRNVEYPSLNSDDYLKELSASPGGEPDAPELLHAHYTTLPIVSHIPQSPCNLHPDTTYLDDVVLHSSLRDLRLKNLSPNMVHSTTYPPTNPYPSLTTVAGTYNPYTCTVPINTNHNSNSFKPQLSPSLITTGKDINANVTQTIPTYAGDMPKSVQSERRVRFGEVTTAPDYDNMSDGSEIAREGSSSPASTLKPAWSSQIKSFAIGEASPPHSANFVKASVSDKKKFFENAMEESHKPSPKPERVFTFLSADEVEKLKQEEERKMASMSPADLRSWSPGGDQISGDSSHSDDEPYENGHSVSLGGVSPSAKSQRRRERREGSEGEDPSTRAARRAAWRAARLRSLEQEAIESQKAIKSLVGPANEIIGEIPSREKSPSEVETTQEKIISLELTTSPSSETAPDLGEAGISLGEGETEGENSLQPDIVQVVNPLLDGGAGRVTAIPVGPADRLTAYTQPQ